MITNPVVGRRYKIISFRSFGSGLGSDPSGRFTKDRLYVYAGIPSNSTDPTGYFQGDTGAACCLFFSDFVEGYANRKEHAEYVLEEIRKIKKDLLEKERMHKRLSEFDSDEEEIAFVLIKATDNSELPQTERIANLAKLLKGRLKTDLI